MCNFLQFPEFASLQITGQNPFAVRPQAFREIQKFVQPHRPADSDGGDVAAGGPLARPRWKFLGRSVCVAAWKMLYGLGSMLSVQWVNFLFLLYLQY
jgi:hypothetical protein